MGLGTSRGGRVCGAARVRTVPISLTSIDPIVPIMSGYRGRRSQSPSSGVRPGPTWQPWRPFVALHPRGRPTGGRHTVTTSSTAASRHERPDLSPRQEAFLATSGDLETPFLVLDLDIVADRFAALRAALPNV